MRPENEKQAAPPRNPRKHFLAPSVKEIGMARVESGSYCSFVLLSFVNLRPGSLRAGSVPIFVRALADDRERAQTKDNPLYYPNARAESPCLLKRETIFSLRD